LLVASSVKTHQSRHDDAIAQARQALELGPNDPAAYEALGIALTYGGKPKEGAEAIRAAMRLDPQHAALYLVWLGLAEFTAERYGDAAKVLREALQSNPEDDTAMIVLLASYGHLGRADESNELLQALNGLRQRRQQQLETIGSGSIEAGIDSFLLGPYTLDDVNLWPFKLATDRERLRVGLQKAGVPETASDDAVSPSFVEGAATVTPAEAKELFDNGAPFVDVRTHARWTLGRIPGAVLLDLQGGYTEASLLDVTAKDGDVVIYCEGPNCLRSSEACAMAVSWGFKKVHYLRLGFPGWRAEGYPVEVD
jgi:rhodanese-related sulfurtransferase